MKEQQQNLILTASDLDLQIAQSANITVSNNDNHFLEVACGEISFNILESIDCSLAVISDCSKSVYHVSANSKVSIACLDLNAKSQIDIFLQENTEVIFDYRSIANQNRYCEINVYHLSRKSKSTLSAFAVVLKEKNSIIKMNIEIKQGARCSVSNQKSGILLIEGGSGRIDPVVKIYEPEAEAGHGAHIGHVNEDQLFYLQSRGIGRRVAIKELICGALRNGLEKYSLKYQEKMDKIIKELII